MSQNLSFGIKISPDDTVKFEQEATFENFIGQFQLFCSKLLCVVDGTYLRYYNKRNELPTNIRFDYKQRRGKLTEYYFRDINTDTLYCVFGRDCAKIFYPRIDEVDPSGMHELIITPSVHAHEESSSHVKKIDPNEQSSVPDRKIIKAIPEPEVTLPESRKIKETTSQPDLGVKITKSIPDRDILRPKATLYESSKKQSGTHSSRSRTDDNLRSSSSSVPLTRPKRPDITITDRNAKMTFPNPDYPVQVYIYEPI
jgi:hypothetical protein